MPSFPRRQVRGPQADDRFLRRQPFNYLTFNLTQTVEGPSLFCAGFAAQFVDDAVASTTGGGGKVKTVKPPPKNPKNPKKAEQLDPAERRR